MRRWWVAVLITASVFALLDWTLTRRHGLTRSAADAGSQSEFAVATVTDVGLDDLDPAIAGRPGITLIWRGVWQVPASDLYILKLESAGQSAWRIDGLQANETAAGNAGPATRAVSLAAGFHQIEIRYRPDPVPARIAVSVARVGHAPSPLGAADLKPSLPRNPQLRSTAEILRLATGWLLLAVLIVAVRKTSVAIGNPWGVWPAWDAVRTRALRSAAWIVLALIVTYGALLRIDAITARYGPVTSPGWLAAVQTRTFLPPAAIRPGWFAWKSVPVFPHQDGPPSHYISDPYTYLKGARDMRSFYEAQWREPMYLFAVKCTLAWLGNQDVAVSFTSAMFAVLAIWLMYILGAAVWSRPVGLLAALALAIDRDAAWFSSQGWRDDAFVAAVVAGAYLILRCWRSAREAPRTIHVASLSFDAAYRDAIVLGTAAGLIVLVRIMALSFLVPGALVIILAVRTGWRRRLTLAGLIMATTTLVAAPYFINCWRVYGDPLYTFNVHGNIYRIAEGRPESKQGTLAYIREKVAARPYVTMDTVSRGLTVYPFGNKWEGLEAWREGLGSLVSMAALAGLVALAFTPAGRLVLFLAITSLLPFSLTWKVDPNPRFTAHVYPILLIAAGVAVSLSVRAIHAVLLPAWRAMRQPWTRDRMNGVRVPNAAAGVATVAGFLVALWFVLLVSPQLVFADALRYREDASVTAGIDDAFFGRGWSKVLDLGNVRMRVATAEGHLHLRLPESDDYKVTFRMDPFPRPLNDAPARFPVVMYRLNGIPLGTIQMQWNPERIGAYEVTLPRAHVRPGVNDVELRLVSRRAEGDDAGGQRGLADGEAFGVWFLRVSRPPS